jgi:acyl-CoA synthetase (AMP-forming)/AMP-acid ligase II
MNIADNLAHSAAAHPDRDAIRLDDTVLSYALLDGATQHVAGLLAERGVRPGDRVGSMLPNVPHFAVLYYGERLTSGDVMFGGLPLFHEEVLYEHPAVAEAAVVGAPHESLGEEVAAVLTLKPGASATPDELRGHVKERVAASKYPRIVRIVDELPKGPTGKILKREITVEAEQ